MKIMRHAVIFIFLLANLVSGGRLFAQSDSDTQSQLKKVESGLVPPVRFEGDSVWTIEGRMKHYGVPGLSIAVVKDSKIAWVKSYGIMDRTSRLPVTNETLFQAASISKAVSSYAALKEVERGKLSLDQDVNLYLKSWKVPENEFNKDKKVSLKYLLSHSAGVTVGGFLGYKVSDQVPTLLQVLNGEAPANSPPIRVDKIPGGSFRYAGGGYVILQQMLMDIEGKSYPEIMNELVLQPLGMTHSTYSQPLPDSKLKWAATGYLPDGSEVPGKRHTYPEMAPAGLWTTAEDLARFIIDIQLTLKGKSSKIISKEMADQMTSSLIEKYEGLGIFLGQKDGDSYFNHGGWNEGFSSQFVGSKDKGYGIVVMTNGNQPLLVNELIRAVANTYNWPGVLPVYKKMEITAIDMQQDTGRYLAEKHEVIKLYAQGDKLFFQKNFEEPDELFKIADNTFTRRNWDAKIKFVVNPSDHIRHIVFLEESDSVRYLNPKLKTGEKVPYELVLDGQFEKALSAYQQINSGNSAIDAGHLNQIGYQLLRMKKSKEAVAIFRLNTLLFPDNFDVYDSLGEGYMNAGDKILAKENYLRSLKLNPNNKNATKMLRQLDNPGQ